MEIWFLDFFDERQGPYSVLAQDNNNYFIEHPDINYCLLAVPKVMVVSKIEVEGEDIIGIADYILLDDRIKSVDFKYPKFMSTEH